MVNDEGPDREKAFREAANAMMSAYEIIALFLEGLPLPIRLPQVDEEWDAAVALPSVHRARALIGEEPIDDMAQGILESVLLEWCACYEMGAMISLAGHAPWRLDAMETALARMAVGLRIVEPKLLPREE